MLDFEQQACNEGFKRVAGVDEAGRGPLAGPVVAAAVGAELGTLLEGPPSWCAGLTDSKQLSGKERERYHGLLLQDPAFSISVGVAESSEIDRLNILCATHRAMMRAVRHLEPAPDFLLVDGRPVPGLPCAARAIIKGDARSLLIAAASVVAKVTRDRLMIELDELYAPYGFARHKGYGTPEHLAALRTHGPAPCHRRSFRPVREALAGPGLFDSNGDNAS